MTHPQTQDDEALVEVMARAIAGEDENAWRLRPNDKAQLRALARSQIVLPGTPTRDDFRDDARAALTALRNHEGRK